jgi:hypothetical protein
MRQLTSVCSWLKFGIDAWRYERAGARMSVKYGAPRRTEAAGNRML